MIELKATGKCVGCPACDPKFLKLFSCDISPIATVVCCRNSAICEQLEKYIADKLSAPYQTDNGKWISVEDSLPGPYDKCIVFDTDHGADAAIFHPSETGPLWYDTVEDYFQYEHVTHWMPMPEGPEAKEAAE